VTVHAEVRPEPGPSGGQPLEEALVNPAAAALDPPHLADARAITILTTEHWGLLTARSLVYNEAFSRGSMFLTFLSASLVALGFVYQGGAGPDFPGVLVAILGLDLFVGLATLGRLVGASREEFLALQGMNRLRHAYLEMVPTLDGYLSASPYDDAGSVLSVYGTTAARPRALLSLTHGLTTMPGLVSVLDAALTGALLAALVTAAGGDMRLAVLAGIGGGMAAMLALSALSMRVFGQMERSIRARFPAPGTGPSPDGDGSAAQEAGRRNT
jgi:hypothetical protein